MVLYLFLALAPVVLIVRFVTHKPAWWLVVLLTLFPGWGLIVMGYFEEQDRIGELVDLGRYDELPEGWDSDGASGLFAVFGGWFFALAYLAPWLGVYALAAIVRRIVRLGPRKRGQ